MISGIILCGGILLTSIMLLTNCGGRAVATAATGVDSTITTDSTALLRFDADSAYHYVKRQVEFGPRIPNSEAHRATADWLAGELVRHGAVVTEQTATLHAFDGTPLNMRNIMGSFNPEVSNRLLLLAHYDTRPWADSDPDGANRRKPIDGANDGASGVAVLLEVARQLGLSGYTKGVDILFVDCEDYGEEGDDDSWALGAKYFAEHPIKAGYRPEKAILLDMVGDTFAEFPAEYFSRQAAPELDDAIRAAARQAGHGKLFPRVFGGAVTDDHVPLIEKGIPAIDIIDYRPGQGFCPTWHTLDDNLENIDPATLRAVGETLIGFIRQDNP